MIPRQPTSTLFPYTTLFRSVRRAPPRLPAVPLGVPVDGTAGTLIRAGDHRPSRPAFRYYFLDVTAGRASPGEHNSGRSEEHTSELQSQSNLVCRLLLEKKKE